MIVQTIEISLSKGRAPELLAHLGESNRQIEMIPDITLPETAGAEIDIVKPDGTFAIQTAEITDGHIIVTLPDQACTVKGLSHYILKITDTGTVIYSAYGNIFVDDHLITDELIESIAEANGYQFPDDFLTDDKLEANPSVSATDTLYRLKIHDTIYGVGAGGGADVEANPTGTPTYTLDALRVDENIYGVEKPIPVEANPSGSATDTLEKIKIGTTTYDISKNVIYSAEEREIGVWVDSKPLYEKTFYFSSVGTGSVDKDISLPNAEYAFIVNANGIDAGGSKLPIPFAHSTASSNAGVFINSNFTKISFRIGNTQNIGKAYVTVRYTKTTDTV